MAACATRPRVAPAAQAFALAVLVIATGATALETSAAGAAATKPPAIGELVVRVQVPNAYCAAVSDAQGVLVIGQRDPAGGRILMFRLGADGKPGSKPVTYDLPRPDPLKAISNYPLALIFHPKLPLLYAWQDLAVPPVETVAQRPGLDLFDHLHVLRVEHQRLAPVAALARGVEYGHGRTTGNISLDPAAARLLLPDARDDAGQPAIGYFDLSAAGIPLQVPVPTPGNLDGFGLDKFEMKLRPVRMALGQEVGSLAAPTPEVALLGVAGGVALWDTTNRRGAVGFVLVPEVVGLCQISADPRLPRVYGTTTESGQDLLVAIDHADGYLTLQPEVVHLGAAIHPRTAPLVMCGRVNRLAIGGINEVHVVPLDAAGHVAGPAQSAPAACPSVRALAYSPKHDRLYVAVEGKP